MALILEDGSNVANSNTYVSLSYADSYFANLNNLDWTGLSDTESDIELKETALIQATLSVELLYGDDYKSYVAFNEQSLLFPRMSFIKNGWQSVTQGTIPKELKDAVCEVAVMYINDANIFPNANTDSNIKVSDKAIGELKKKLEYFKATNPEKYKGFGKVEKILRPILNTANAQTTSGIMSL